MTSCRALLKSTFPTRAALDLLDSTQVTNPPPALPVRLVHAAVRCGRFVRRIEAGRPDVVLLFVSPGASVVEKGVMAWYARVRGVPAIMFPRATVSAYQSSPPARLCTRLAFRGARRVVCQSEDWRRFSIAGLGFAASSVQVIRNWTATSDLLGIGADRTRTERPVTHLVFVGWLEREKGIMELIDACHRLSGRWPFVLDVIGDGRAAAAARARVAETGLEDIVRFRGWLGEADVHEALRMADVFVLPSWAEGLPNSMIEAMAARLAIVVSSVGAIPDVVKDRRSGLLVTAKDSDSLTAALASVIGSRKLRDRLAAEAYSVARREFGVEEAVGKLMETIEKVVVMRQPGNSTS